jgi:NADPH-dependent glutamate synthase beta subunit-like oxidoreductase
MKAFTHIDAKTVAEAVELLAEQPGAARVLAGGTDLLGALKNEIYTTHPQAIINVRPIRGLDFIKKDAEGLRIGALTRLSQIVDSPVVRKEWPVLADAAQSIGSPQIRNMATIGGNLCQDVRCWFYRASPFIGERYECMRKGGTRCYALTTENQYHSVFGAANSGTPGCALQCPGKIDIPSYFSKIREGDLDSAARILLDSNPMPAVTGRVCPHFCEEGCVRNEFDEPLSVRAMERYIGDYILDHADELVRPVKQSTGKRIAIVGSGPAGLAAAYYCITLGHTVTVFEKLEQAGGMLSYGIPEYILPRETVQRTVDALKKAGVEFRLGVEVGCDVSVKEVGNSFDSLFLGTGAWAERSIGIEGEGLAQSALSFLMGAKRGARAIPGKKVLVIGGGNVAVDAAITARRLGAEDVTMVCLECTEEMPALPWEIAQAIEEGIKLMPSWGPTRVFESNGKIVGLELARCTSVFDDNHCFAPVFDHGDTTRIEGDSIIMAVGQARNLSGIGQELSLDVSGGVIVVDAMSQATNLPGVFAGGDSTSPQGTVIEALAAGRRAALAMDAYLGGTGKLSDIENRGKENGFLRFSTDCAERKKRATSSVLPVPERSLEKEDLKGLQVGQVEDEAQRCFNCGCVAVHPSDIATVLMALNGKIVVAGPKGSRTIPIEEFVAPLGVALGADEIVTEIQVPHPEKGSKQTFLKFRLRNALDFAMVSVAANVTRANGTCTEARIVLGSVAPSPMRAIGAEQAIIGKAIDTSLAEAAAQVAAAGSVALARNGYKVELVKALVKRALLIGADRGT